MVNQKAWWVDTFCLEDIVGFKYQKVKRGVLVVLLVVDTKRTEKCLHILTE